MPAGSQTKTYIGCFLGLQSNQGSACGRDLKLLLKTPCQLDKREFTTYLPFLLFDECFSDTASLVIWVREKELKVPCAFLYIQTECVYGGSLESG